MKYSISNRLKPSFSTSHLKKNTFSELWFVFKFSALTEQYKKSPTRKNISQLLPKITDEYIGQHSLYTGPQVPLKLNMRSERMHFLKILNTVFPSWKASLRRKWNIQNLNKTKQKQQTRDSGKTKWNGEIGRTALTTNSRDSTIQTTSSPTGFSCTQFHLVSIIDFNPDLLHRNCLTPPVCCEQKCHLPFQ